MSLDATDAKRQRIQEEEDPHKHHTVRVGYTPNGLVNITLAPKLFYFYLYLL
jgi:hypothetical protein